MKVNGEENVIETENVMLTSGRETYHGDHLTPLATLAVLQVRNICVPLAVRRPITARIQQPLLWLKGHCQRFEWELCIQLQRKTLSRQYYLSKYYTSTNWLRYVIYRKKSRTFFYRQQHTLRASSARRARLGGAILERFLWTAPSVQVFDISCVWTHLRMFRCGSSVENCEILLTLSCVVTWCGDTPRYWVLCNCVEHSSREQNIWNVSEDHSWTTVDY